MSRLTPDEIATCVDEMLRSLPWVRPLILAAPDDRTAAKIADRELRNGGMWWNDDHATCRACGQIPLRCPDGPDAEDVREDDGPGWYCDTEGCELAGYKVAECVGGGWGIDALRGRGKGMAIVETPRLGNLLPDVAGVDKAKREGVPVITWAEVATYVRHESPPQQMEMAL